MTIPNNFQWWQTGTIYQIYPRSFMDTNADGIGDLQGIINRLDYLAWLGIDAIWISPFYRSPMKDFGYDVADYCDVDPMFGNLADFDRLLAEAHQRGLKVIIDWVPNHTSDQHPWFVESRYSRTSAKRNWYIWRDPKPDGSPPNNWGSFFGGPAWTFDEGTGQYYLHQFVPEQPELNWRNPEVEQAMYETLRFWLRRGVDGFRMDVIGLIIKDATLRDNPLNPNANPNLRTNDLFGRLIQKYNMDQDEVHPYIRRIRKVLDEFPDRCGIGELWGELPRWVRYYGEHGDGLQLPFNFRLINEPWQAAAMRTSVNQMEAILPEFAWPNYVLGNHDQPRLVSRYGGQAQARAAAMLLLTLRGTPTLYYGDELGMPNADIPLDKIQDPQGKNLGPERNRDSCRTPMQWDASLNAGFSPVEPWLPVPADYAARNVASFSADPTSILNLYRHLIALRRTSPALHAGRYTALDSSEAVFAYLRVQGPERKLIVINFSGESQRASLPAWTGKILLSTYLDRQDEIVPVDTISLRPHEGLLLDL
jgi:alpha-glucosidase